MMKPALVVMGLVLLAGCRDRSRDSQQFVRTDPQTDRSGTGDPVTLTGSTATPSNESVVPMPVTAKAGPLLGKTLAFLATDDFEESELLKPRQMFADRGAKTIVVGPKAGTIQGKSQRELGRRVAVDRTLDDASANAFDGLVLPGGVGNPDQLRTNPKAVSFVRSFAESGKPIAAICHAPWLLIEAGLARGRTLTSWPSLKTDLTNAGARWIDQEAVVDGLFVTSRNPGDIPAFVEAATTLFVTPPALPAKQAGR